MPRPRTGQRNDGIAPIASALLTTVSVVRGSSLATLATCAGAMLATFVGDGVRGWVTCGAAGGCAAATGWPPAGMVIRSPTLSLLVVRRRLARASAVHVTPLRRGMLISVSPFCTVWTLPREAVGTCPDAVCVPLSMYRGITRR